MAKYIIDIPDSEETMWEGFNGDLFIPITMNKGTKTWVNTDLKMTPYTEPNEDNAMWMDGYEKGVEAGRDDAWELIQKVAAMTYRELDDAKIPQSWIASCKHQEIKTKYKEWQKQKDEIHVGDEVIAPDPYYESMVVTSLRESDRGDMWLSTIGNDGMVYEFMETSVKKTGRHFPEVAELLKKMGKLDD